MVNKLSYKTAKDSQSWDNNQANEYLLARGLTTAHLDELAKHRPLEQRLRVVGDAFADAGFHDFIEPDIALAAYSSEWEQRSQIATKDVKLLLAEKYYDKSVNKSKEYGFALPRRDGLFMPSIIPLQIYREETGNYRGNLYEARDFWRNFIPSRVDFAKNICIPTFDVQSRSAKEEAFLMGVVYAQGSIFNSNKNNPSPNRLFISGGATSYDFYVDDVNRLISEVFNVQDSFGDDRGRSMRSSALVQTFDKDSPSPHFTIDSYAIGSWLWSDLGMPTKGSKLDGFPLKYFSTDMRRDFLLGYIQASASYSSGKIKFHDDRVGYLSAVRDLIRQFSSAKTSVNKNGVKSSKTKAKVLSVLPSQVPQFMSDLRIGHANLRPKKSK